MLLILYNWVNQTHFDATNNCHSKLYKYQFSRIKTLIYYYITSFCFFSKHTRLLKRSKGGGGAVSFRSVDKRAIPRQTPVRAYWHHAKWRGAMWIYKHERERVAVTPRRCWGAFLRRTHPWHVYAPTGDISDQHLSRHYISRDVAVRGTYFLFVCL